MLLSPGHFPACATAVLKFVQDNVIIRFLECVVEYSYRDCLSEEIEILRLMLYKDEFSLDSSAREHCKSLVIKIAADMKELADIDAQPAA